jgi:two-component system cell cycle response regulator
LYGRTTDALTGIPNRLKFNDIIGREISRARRHGTPLTLIMFDIDHFKRINDTYGHRAGDIVLQELTGLIAAYIRKEDLFARWGGEEFIIILTSCGQDGGRVLAERFRLRVEQNTFSVAKKVTCSFGVAQLLPEEDENALIHRVDQALYSAKKGGRNRVEVSAG